MDIVLGRDICGELAAAEAREWLVTNGIGGYASGTVASLSTRRYHAILMAALDPPVSRTLLVSKLDETAEYDGQEYPLFTNRWADGTVDPHGYRHTECFTLDGSIPRWAFACADAILQKRVWMEQGANTTYIRYDLVRASGPLTLTVKALVNYRADHSATRGKGWIMRVEPVPHGVRVHPFPGARPFVMAAREGSVKPTHVWHEGFELSAERERGLDHYDDHLQVATFLGHVGTWRLRDSCRERGSRSGSGRGAGDPAAARGGRGCPPTMALGATEESGRVPRVGRTTGACSGPVRCAARRKG